MGIFPNYQFELDDLGLTRSIETSNIYSHYL